MLAVPLSFLACRTGNGVHSGGITRRAPGRTSRSPAAGPLSAGEGPSLFFGESATLPFSAPYKTVYYHPGPDVSSGGAPPQSPLLKGGAPEGAGDCAPLVKGGRATKWRGDSVGSGLCAGPRAKRPAGKASPSKGEAVSRRLTDEGAFGGAPLSAPSSGPSGRLPPCGGKAWRGAPLKSPPSPFFRVCPQKFPPPIAKCATIVVR